MEVTDRTNRGMGLQNFKYGPALANFAQVAAIVSPELYKMFATHFRVPNLQTLAYVAKFKFLCRFHYDNAQCF